MTLPDDKTVARVDSELAAVSLWTAYGNQQDSELFQTQAAESTDNVT